MVGRSKLRYPGGPCGELLSLARRFLISLTDCNLDHSQFDRTLPDLYREEDWRVSAGFVTKVKELLPRIPPVERDVIELYFVLGKKQEVIARMLGLSQQAVSHRLHAAYRRIVFMLYQPQVDAAQMKKDLLALVPNPFTVDVLCDFAKTSSQTLTARRLKVPQQRVCWHLNAGLRTLHDSPLALDAAFYVQYFQQLRSNRNILREVLAGRRKKVDSGDETQYARFARGPAYGYAGHYAFPARVITVLEATA